MVTLPQTIERYIAAYNARDVEGMLACLTQDVRFLNVSGGAVSAQTETHAAFADLARFGVEAFSQRQQTVTEAITVHTVTACRIDYTATVAMDLPNGWTAGQRLSFQGASAFTLRNGLICSLIDES